MATLRNCIDWNSNAVALLREGRKKEAADTIKKSLKSLEALFHSTREASTMSTTDNYQQSVVNSVLVEGPTSRNSPSNLFSFYPKMLNISSSASSISQVLVVLLYNLAVLSHIDVMIQKPPSPQRLMKSLELYETAMKVAHTSWTAQDADSMVLVLLAVTNNVGHIHSHLLNFQQTRESLSLQMHLLSRACEESPIPMDDYEVFFESVCTFLDGHDLTLAPAA